MKTGDVVRVRIGRSGIVQDGTVVSVTEDRFVWKNRCNFARTAKMSDVTSAPLNDKHSNAYMQAWIEEGDE